MLKPSFVIQINQLSGLKKTAIATYANTKYNVNLWHTLQKIRRNSELIYMPKKNKNSRFQKA